MLTGQLGLDALRTAMENKHRFFDAKGDNVNSGGYRRKVPGLCTIHHSPKFVLTKSSEIYTVGSCFAREVENALKELGVSLTSDGLEFPVQWVDPNHAQARNKSTEELEKTFGKRTPINRYSTHSITYDFERVFTDRGSFEETILDLGDGSKYWDPQVKNIKLGDLEHTKSVRELLDKNILSAKRANVIIITLGMTETWFDSAHGAILPTPPLHSPLSPILSDLDSSTPVTMKFLKTLTICTLY
tara:strand:+ start:1043 stop:1774 length:732 start_codon:yes stop_codon:yes gene_type:complete